MTRKEVTMTAKRVIRIKAFWFSLGVATFSLLLVIKDVSSPKGGDVGAYFSPVHNIPGAQSNIQSYGKYWRSTFSKCFTKCITHSYDSAKKYIDTFPYLCKMLKNPDTVNYEWRIGIYPYIGYDTITDKTRIGVYFIPTLTRKDIDSLRPEDNNTYYNDRMHSYTDYMDDTSIYPQQKKGNTYIYNAGNMWP